jgi:hypothetical protein
LPLTAQECRAKALECNERGAETSDFGVKIQYQQLAERWQVLADQLERDEQVKRVELSGSDWSAKSARTAAPGTLINRVLRAVGKLLSPRTLATYRQRLQFGQHVDAYPLRVEFAGLSKLHDLQNDEFGQRVFRIPVELKHIAHPLKRGTHRLDLLGVQAAISEWHGRTYVLTPADISPAGHGASPVPALTFNPVGGAV